MQSITFETQTLSYEINEEMKQLRANLQFTGEDKKVILVTSTLENEGKSTISLELARSLTALGKRVFLIDTDMRKSILQDKTVGEAKNGLSHFLSGQATLDDTICLCTTEPNLFVMIAGRVPPNPAELLGGAKMKKLVDWARQKFDYVILDCPPIKMVVDAAMVAPLSDGCIFVLKANAIPRKLAQAALKQIERTGCPILGVILNEVDVRGKGKYYYNKYYRHYSNYGHYGHDPKAESADSAQ